jgi:hypothetical protein
MRYILDCRFYILDFRLQILDLLLLVLIEDDECSEDARYPTEASQQEDDQYRTAAAVNHGQWRKDDC